MHHIVQSLFSPIQSLCNLITVVLNNNSFLSLLLSQSAIKALCHAVIVLSKNTALFKHFAIQALSHSRTIHSSELALYLHSEATIGGSPIRSIDIRAHGSCTWSSQAVSLPSTVSGPMLLNFIVYTGTGESNITRLLGIGS